MAFITIAAGDDAIDRFASERGAMMPDITPSITTLLGLLWTVLLVATAYNPTRKRVALFAASLVIPGIFILVATFLTNG